MRMNGKCLRPSLPAMISNKGRFIFVCICRRAAPLSPDQTPGKQHIDEHEQLGSRELDSTVTQPVVESESEGESAGGLVYGSMPNIT